MTSRASESKPAVLEARGLMRASHVGSLATVSKRLDGYPYASAVSFITDHSGSPILLISRIAEHTKNLESDPRSSLLVHEASADVQAAARLTLIGSCRRIDASVDIRDRYLRLLPAASGLLQLDFGFYRLDPIAIRYIGGFGSIHWLSADAFLTANSAFQQQEETSLRHINATRLPALRLLYRQRHGDEPDGLQALALDVDGIDIGPPGGVIMRLTFLSPLESIGDLDLAIDALTHRP